MASMALLAFIFATLVDLYNRLLCIKDENGVEFLLLARRLRDRCMFDV
jgi:hypothetical protein